VGIGARLDKAANLRNRWRKFVRRVEDQKKLKFDLSKQSAFRIPFGVPKIPLVTRRTMLVGDAAGLVSPLSGEGIYYAIKSGMMAAQFACEAAKMKKPFHVMKYGKAIREDILIELSAAEYLANILYKSIKNTDLVFQMIQDDLIMREHIIHFMAGARPFRDLRNDIRNRMLAKHPIKALKLRF
jgi:flavin-dependent dehydrogenase